MPNKWIPWVKVLVHAVCLIPLLDLYRTYKSGSLVLLADPVNYVTHQTGFWALWLLIASLAVTPVRRLHPKLANLAAAGAVCVLLCDAAPGDLCVPVLGVRRGGGVGRLEGPACGHHRRRVEAGLADESG